MHTSILRTAVRTLATACGLVLVIAAASVAAESGSLAPLGPADDQALAVQAHTCDGGVTYYQADYDLDGNGRPNLFVFGPVLRAPDGARLRGAARAALLFVDGPAAPWGQAYVVSNGLIHEMTLAEFTGTYPTPCVLFGLDDFI